MILIYQWLQRCQIWNRVLFHQHVPALLLHLFRTSFHPEPPRPHVDVEVDVGCVDGDAVGVAF